MEHNPKGLKVYFPQGSRTDNGVVGVLLCLLFIRDLELVRPIPPKAQYSQNASSTR